MSSHDEVLKAIQKVKDAYEALDPGDKTYVNINTSFRKLIEELEGLEKFHNEISNQQR